MARCAVSSVTPAARKTAASSGPASANHTVHSPIDRIGPTMKTISSTTASSEYAVCSSSGEPRWIADQRARTMAPMLGVSPAPGTHTKNAQSGAPARTHTSSADTEATVTAVTGRSTRRCPYRSTSRDTCGPHTAPDSARVADSAPASPYRPVICEIMVTMPMPSIDSGIRPTSPAALNALAPGVLKIAR